jgi:hypothetical protein
MGVDAFECARMRKTISSFVWRHATLQPGTERDDLGLGISMIEIPAFLHPCIISNPYSVSALVLGGPGVGVVKNDVALWLQSQMTSFQMKS